MAECPCSNITIMQLFHELKQRFPAVPDRVVTECIKLNAHDKEACEEVLEKENQLYSCPGDRLCKMAAEGNHEHCRPDTLQLENTVWDFDRRLLGRQSLDSLCRHSSGRQMCKQYAEEFLNYPREQQSDENCGAISRLSIQDNSRQSQSCYQEHGESRSSDVVLESERSCHCERTKIMSHGRGAAHSAPVTPSNYPVPSFPPLTVDVSSKRHCTTINMDPMPHQQGLPEPLRPYTSVNLTLRPPSSDPQPPINISSGAGGLTYSSCSYDPRQGYQSRLQISIGPGGQGTVTAGRTMSHRPPPSPSTLRPAISLPDVATTSSQLMEPAVQCLPLATKALVTEQLQRKERLCHELNKYRERLCSMQLDVDNMKTDLEARLKAPAPSVKVKKLKEEISQLQSECNHMAHLVYHNAEIRHVNTETLPLGETNEEFYQNIYRGQLFPRQAVRQRGGPVAGAGAREGRSWTCHVCTFHNHPALNKCEQCDMPCINTGAETQNIHIHVTHHNVPSSPYRRVVHSWVV